METTLADMQKAFGFNTWLEMYDWLVKVGKENSSLISSTGENKCAVSGDQIRREALREIYSVLPDAREKTKLMNAAIGYDRSVLENFLFHKLPNI